MEFLLFLQLLDYFDIFCLGDRHRYEWLNDKENVAISTIISNVELTCTKSCVKITKKDYIKCLKQIQGLDLTFDIIFLDPPYDKGLIDEALDGIIKFNLLKENGIIVCEFNHKEDIDTKSFPSESLYSITLSLLGE